MITMTSDSIILHVQQPEMDDIFCCYFHTKKNIYDTGTVSYDTVKYDNNIISLLSLRRVLVR